MQQYESGSVEEKGEVLLSSVLLLLLLYVDGKRREWRGDVGLRMSVLNCLCSRNEDNKRVDRVRYQDSNQKKGKQNTTI